MNEDWGKSKMEIIAEARKAKAEDDRKQKLLGVLESYQAEDTTRGELKVALAEREAAVNKFLDAAIDSATQA
jgi:hypothetical protein